MKLRIVTVTRGKSRFLGDAVASVSAAAAGAGHVIVCPPGCTITAAGSGSPAAIEERRPGLYPALNQALREPGDWDAFTWINDDDVLRAPGFGGLVKVMAADPAIDVAYGRVDLINVRGEGIGALPTARAPADIGPLFARGIIPFAQPGTVIRRRLYEKLGGLDETYRLVGDMDFFVRAIAARARFAFVDELVASFRLSAGQLSKNTGEVAAETARAFRLLDCRRGSVWPLVRFRLTNLDVYLDRIRRHGFVSMRQLYDRTR